MIQVIAPVASNTEVMSGAHLLWLQAPEIASIAQPGQFVMVRCGEGYDPLLRRPLSIHRVSKEGQIALLFGVVGRGTQWLSLRQEGDHLDLMGPLGKGYSIRSPSSLLLVAGGMGIAPLVFVAEKALSQGCPVTLLMGVQNTSSLYPEDLLPSPVNLIIATEDGSKGRRGMVTSCLPDFIDKAEQVLACGPVSMYRTMAAEPQLKGKSVQISLEVRMGCGRGVCYGCTVKTRNGLKQVCYDGPVFELEDIIWEELAES